MTIKRSTLSVEITKKVQIDYLISFPDGYADQTREWGLIVFLHGMDMRGDNVTQLLNYGLLEAANEGNLSLPFVVAVPQCPSESYWNMERDAVTALIEELSANHRVDGRRIFLIGYSLGGYGVWDLAIHNPKMFAAIVPLSSGGQVSKAEKLKDISIWAFHGAKDDIVPLEQMTDMVSAIEKHQGNVRLTIYPDLGHDIMRETLSNQELYTWLLEQTK
ncbi:prolyl oligopeptidase family serine peptidase [Paenibacillus sp. V4I5]|uniref:carboxylesterase family protein n=1 Tax=Paenibacillus sp. V4I5 TaxID=3042306 RepID=UPI002790D650|nr:prolyl oligopeptidase family serine peptidase [Paenibacillus sp. V4I5]MDQ0914653.1 putative peptidase [Paenibacillus sp. V4I5]